jgi:hypothetical protein
MHPKRNLRHPHPAMPPSVHVVWLRGEVLRLREQATAWRELYCSLDREFARVEAHAARENQGLRDRNACLAERLLAALRALDAARTEARADRSQHRREIAALQARCDGLAALCDALLDAAEIAFGSGWGARGPTELPPHAQGSA